MIALRPFPPVNIHVNVIIADMAVGFAVHVAAPVPPEFEFPAPVAKGNLASVAQNHGYPLAANPAHFLAVGQYHGKQTSFPCSPDKQA